MDTDESNLDAEEALQQPAAAQAEPEEALPEEALTDEAEPDEALTDEAEPDEALTDEADPELTGSASRSRGRLVPLAEPVAAEPASAEAEPQRAKPTIGASAETEPAQGDAPERPLGATAAAEVGPLDTASSGFIVVDSSTPTVTSYQRETADQTAAHWPEIQAMFVDDPRGSVQLALQAVDEALAQFVAGLREQQAALTPVSAADGDDSGTGLGDANPADTEQLRTALRSSRTFWQHLIHLSDQLRQPDRTALTAVRSDGEPGS